MMNDVITLVSRTYDTDETGELVSTEEHKEIFAGVQSVGMKEFYEAMAQGLKPEIRFVLSDYLDYDGQQTVIHEGKRYEVMRTFRKDLSTLEIVCTGVVND